MDSLYDTNKLMIAGAILFLIIFFMVVAYNSSKPKNLEKGCSCNNGYYHTNNNYSNLLGQLNNYSQRLNLSSTIIPQPSFGQPTNGNGGIVQPTNGNVNSQSTSLTPEQVATLSQLLAQLQSLNGTLPLTQMQLTTGLNQVVGVSEVKDIKDKKINENYNKLSKKKLKKRKSKKH